jgi:hypothetical protein
MNSVVATVMLAVSVAGSAALADASADVVGLVGAPALVGWSTGGSPPPPPPPDWCTPDNPDPACHPPPPPRRTRVSPGLL